MSDVDKAADSYRVLAVGLAILGSCGMAHAGYSSSSILSITGSDALSITGSDALSITGSDALSITGSDALSITGSDALSITGSDALSITGSDALSITGSDAFSITGSDALSITGSDALSITGSDALSITGSDALSITGSDAELLALGAITYVGDTFISVLGQTAFVDVDADTGGILDAQVFAVSASFGGASYLRGIVDEVDLAGGFAVVSGMTVDYSALLSNGSAPEMGDEVSVTGWSYGDASLLVADPLSSLD
jgi:hypothetical protein